MNFQLHNSSLKSSSVCESLQVLLSAYPLTAADYVDSRKSKLTSSFIARFSQFDCHFATLQLLLLSCLFVRPSVVVGYSLCCLVLAAFALLLLNRFFFFLRTPIYFVSVVNSHVVVVMFFYCFRYFHCTLWAFQFICVANVDILAAIIDKYFLVVKDQAISACIHICTYVYICICALRLGRPTFLLLKYLVTQHLLAPFLSLRCLTLSFPPFFCICSAACALPVCFFTTVMALCCRFIVLTCSQRTCDSLLWFICLFALRIYLFSFQSGITQQQRKLIFSKLCDTLLFLYLNNVSFHKIVISLICFCFLINCH